MKSIKTKFKAFTLAEVLITLGIIGVVAAMTIPTLIQNTNSKKFSSQFKKTISTMSQAALGSVARYDSDYASISTPSAAASCATDSLASRNYTMCAILNNSLAGARYEKLYGSDNYRITPTTTGFNPSGFLLYTLADGSMVGFNPGLVNCSHPNGQTFTETTFSSSNNMRCVGFIDVNGSKGPNREVTCSGGASNFGRSPCVIDEKKIDDVFPVFFHDAIAEPATNAGNAVLKGSRIISGNVNPGGY